MLVFKNRSNYVRHLEGTPTTWEQAVTDREIVWKLDLQGLSYRVVGRRVNHGGNVIMPEHSQVTLYEGVKTSTYAANPDTLRAIADAWAATVSLTNGEVYHGHNALGEGPTTPQVNQTSEGPYPYFQTT